MRLEECSTTYQYVALSYVWGQVPQPKTTPPNLGSSLEAGPLNQRKSKISLVIPDATTIAVKARENYLWVDALCIVQDEIRILIKKFATF